MFLVRVSACGTWSARNPPFGSGRNHILNMFRVIWSGGSVWLKGRRDEYELGGTIYSVWLYELSMNEHAGHRQHNNY